MQILTIELSQILTIALLQILAQIDSVGAQTASFPLCPYQCMSGKGWNMYYSYLRYMHSHHIIHSLTSSETCWYRGLKLGLIVLASECAQCIEPGSSPYWSASDCLSSQPLCVIRKMPLFKQNYSILLKIMPYRIQNLCLWHIQISQDPVSTGTKTQT